MKHLYACLALACLAFGARAQTIYRPLLRPGVVYQFAEAGTAGDTTHTVRLSYAGPHPAPDSLGRFNGRTVRVPARPTTCPWLSHVLRPDGLFGATVTIGFRRHEYLLRAANGRTLLLKTQAPLNQPWAATAAGLTARTTARGVGTVLGVSDSITTITFSDGQTLRLSKTYGFIEGPALGSYLNGQPPRRLTLTALGTGGRWLGQPAVGPAAMYDFQPGDVFLRYNKQEGTQTGSICSESWVRDSVLTRTLSRAADTVRYTIWRRVLTRNYGSPSAPGGFCQNTPGTTLTPGSVHSLAVAVNDENPLALLTHTLTSGTVVWRNLTLAGVRTANFHGRNVQNTITRQVCPSATPADSVEMSDILDNGTTASYAVGLGQVLSCTSGIYYTYYNTLIGYRKVNLPTSTGTETWGSLRPFASILKAADHRPAATTAAFPNPFARELTVRFETARPQRATVRVYNGLGQLVQQLERPVAAGAAELRLQLPALPAGLYTLHLQHDGRTEVLRLTAAQ
ncbi:hypothetical protein GCM10027048_33380 [Hymenobacter coalescens]